MEFSAAGFDDVPISVGRAERGTAGLFPPVEIHGRYYVDGARSRRSMLPVALRDGAELVLCVNPLVPFDSELAERRDHKSRHSVNHLVEGLPVVLSQTFRRSSTHA